MHVYGYISAEQVANKWFNLFLSANYQIKSVHLIRQVWNHKAKKLANGCRIILMQKRRRRILFFLRLFNNSDLFFHRILLWLKLQLIQ